VKSVGPSAAAGPAYARTAVTSRAAPKDAFMGDALLVGADIARDGASIPGRAKCPAETRVPQVRSTATTSRSSTDGTVSVIFPAEATCSTGAPLTRSVTAFTR